ncbi:hypothetical protein [Cupriavidus agavae]|uniref:Uncharacterized protein n=1 Tax=Cupriavidus agavae TaxID=1001822 RepID=A0A4Q7RZ58_9BURK|nr:hypothetical protein [Cupriavidus agavae]RZT39176.1 hypothetical protein EV147_2371 [Cupriavidus agavae]
MFVDRTEILNAAKALRASQEEAKYSKLVALANKQLKAMQTAILKGKEEFETTLILDISDENPETALEPRAHRLADDLRAQGYTATVTTFAEASADRKNWTPNITVVIGLGDIAAEGENATAVAMATEDSDLVLAGEATSETA